MVAPAPGALILAAAGALLLAGCTTSIASAPAPRSPSERQWLSNADSFIGTLDSDVLLRGGGGANPARPRPALHDSSAIYTMLVAYELFGDCGQALANVGVPSARAAPVTRSLGSACARLEDASALFQEAMSRREPRRLLAATRTVLRAVPYLSAAKLELAALARATR